MRNGIRTLPLVSVASQRHWLKGKIFSAYSRGLEPWKQPLSPCLKSPTYYYSCKWQLWV